MRLSEPAPAKINLALHVRGRRVDGYHELETLFAFCIDGDMLQAESSEDTSLKIIGPFSNQLSDQDNLVLAAASQLRGASGANGGASLFLDKKLPVASGLGGGSADAAATLRLLTRMWKIDPGHAEAIASTLGADVPACLLSMTARGEGVGERLSPVDIPALSGTPVLLVNPGAALSTSEVFAAWDGQDRGPLGEDWRAGRNDLEVPARTLVPEIGDVLDWLASQAGATIARMSGSGASCFALFESEGARDAAVQACPDHWWHLATFLR